MIGQTPQHAVSKLYVTWLESNEFTIILVITLQSVQKTFENKVVRHGVRASVGACLHACVCVYGMQVQVGREIGRDRGGREIGRDRGGREIGRDRGGREIGRDRGGREIGRDRGGREIGRDIGGREIGRNRGGREIEKK